MFDTVNLINQHKKETIMDSSSLDDAVNLEMMPAKIASEARCEEIKNFIQATINDMGVNDIVICNFSQNNNIEKNIPSIYIEFSPVSTTYTKVGIFLAFHNDDGMLKSTVTPCNMNHIQFSSTNVCNNRFLSFVNTFCSKLNELDKLINSEVFHSYQSDIDAFLKAKKDLSDFNKEKRLQTIEAMMGKFNVHDKICTNKNIFLTIKKITRKRLYVTNYFVGQYEKKTVDKRLAAQWIVDEHWHYQKIV